MSAPLTENEVRYQNAALADENKRLRKALAAVEEWWLSEGMKHFTGAPYAIFATRAALNDD